MTQAQPQPFPAGHAARRGGLYPHRRHAHPRERLAGRPVRDTARLHLRRKLLYSGFPALRPVHLASHARRLAGVARYRGSHDDACGTPFRTAGLPAHRAGRRTQLHQHSRPRRPRGGPSARRLAGDVCHMALDLPDQHPHRAHRHSLRLPHHAGFHGSAPPLRLDGLFPVRPEPRFLFQRP